MKLRKTILTTLLLSFFCFGFTAQASIQSCNHANDELRAAIQQHGGHFYTIYIQGEAQSIYSPPTSFGISMINAAAALVMLECEALQIGIG